ncbi:MAG: hypothetical protein OXB84_02140, partial [Halobacteriovoraceae bacterium]|nr:hypothetical protein [Halobacteriovoraceae bacterium]
MKTKGARLDLPQLPQYHKIKETLNSERKTLLKIRNLEEEDSLVRTIKDAEIVLDGIQKIQTFLWNSFSNHSSLIILFNNEFLSFSRFLQHDYILEICFFEDYLIPDRELFYFDQGEHFFSEYYKWFEEWFENKKNSHLKNQEFLDEMTIDVREKDMECACSGCISRYRSNLRKLVVTECVGIIDESEENISDGIDQGIEKISEIYRKMHRSVEQKIYRVRYGLKRSSLKKVESKLKNEIRE